MSKQFVFATGFDVRDTSCLSLYLEGNKGNKIFRVGSVKQLLKMYTRYVYYISRAYGLTPFAYDKTTHKVEKSLTASVICLLICVTLNGVQLSLIVKVILGRWRSEELKFVDLLVRSIAAFSTNSKNVIMQLIFIYRRNDLIKMLNILHKLYNSCPDMKFSPNEYLKSKQTILIFKALQVLGIFLLGIIDSVTSYRTLPVTAVRTIMITFPMIITTFYFCGAIFVSTCFFEILISKLKNIHQSNADDDLDNEIDCAIVLYDRITNVVRKINKIFGLPITIYMVTTFVFCLSAVRKKLCSLVANIKFE